VHAASLSVVDDASDYEVRALAPDGIEHEPADGAEAV
jgi:hypothetical protein